MAVDWEFMYIGSAGRGQGRKGGRTAGRKGGRKGGWKVGQAIFIDFEWENTTVQCFSSILNEKARWCNDFHRFLPILNDCTTIFIGFQEKHDFERQYNYFHRCSEETSKSSTLFTFSNLLNAEL